MKLKNEKSYKLILLLIIIGAFFINPVLSYAQVTNTTIEASIWISNSRNPEALSSEIQKVIASWNLELNQNKNESKFTDITNTSINILQNTIDDNSIELETKTVGDYLQDVSSGNGIEILGTKDEGWTAEISLGDLKKDWKQQSSYDVILDDEDSNLKILDNTGSYYATFDVGDLTEDTVLTFSGTSGTVLTTGNFSQANGSLLATNNLSDITNVATARTNLGLGTISTQNSSGVSITGGSITGITDLAIADGGTGLSTIPSNGEVLIGNGAGYGLSALTSGTGVSITNGSGTITITNSGVTALNSQTGSISVAGAGINGISTSSGLVTITGTEADTLSAVTARGSSTSTALTLSNSANSITVGTLTATGGTINGITIGATTPSTGVFSTINGLTITNNGSNTLNIAADKTLTANKTLTFDGTDSTTLTFPSTSDTIVGRTSTDTLTNKTLTAPTINGTVTTSGLILPAYTLSGNITGSGSPTLSSIGSINGLTFTSNATGFSIAGGTSSKTLTVNKSIILDGTDGTTLTLPSTTDTIVGRTSSDTLTNKTISGSSNTVSGIPLVYSNTTIPAGNTIANTTSETAFASSYIIPANTLAAGNVIRIKLYGTYGTTVISPSLTGKVKIGSTTVLNTGAITAVANLSNVGWWAEAVFIVHSAGSSGVIDAQGYAEFATAATTGLSVNIANTSTYTIDTTADQTITIPITWSAASASNTITLRQMTVEVLK